MNRIHFTVDSALLRELGERLVGQPHIALAELVKNSFDADATRVLVRIADDRIEICDNGHGMTFGEFRDFWMRVGSPHKQEQRTSRDFGRPLTGSKGVGRLAVQFLARGLAMHTVAKGSLQREIDALVDWDTAVDQGDLTEAFALYAEVEASRRFAGGSPHGTLIELSHLNQSWSADDIEALAKEIWWLQPPFERTATKETETGFRVNLQSTDPRATQRFDSQMRAYLDIWHARISGELVTGDHAEPTVRLQVDFDDGEKIRHELGWPPCHLQKLSFEIRTYYLQGRQQYGIRVGEARDYFNEFGGVRVYDAGFRLPYYGPEHDWLDIERDHSHRLSRSRLLPASLQIPAGLTYLPTNSRLLGFVKVDTSFERAHYQADSERLKKQLEIQVTRDRLTDNEAYRQLCDIVRWALDFYAMQEAKRRFSEAEASRSEEPAHEKFLRVEEVLEHFQDALPSTIFSELESRVREAIHASETEAEAMTRRLGLLGPLATAGIAALAHEHEAAKQLDYLDIVIGELEMVASRNSELQGRLNPLLEKLRTWSDDARATRAMFSHLLEEENRTGRGRYLARELLHQIIEQIQPVTRSIPITVDRIPGDLRLPSGGFPEWTALFQNIFLNAVNALLDTEHKKIDVSVRSHERRRSILIQDTGAGVDLERAAELFEPFERRLRISPERQALGYGGSGLGLTIVRMISTRLGCSASFVQPESGFHTAFALTWKED